MSTPPRPAALTRFLTRAAGSSRRWARPVDPEARLRQAREELLETHRRKSAFLASLSHQLRTPLTTILLSSELLAEDLAAQGLTALGGDVESIQSAGRHLLGLLDDILDLTRMEAGRMVFRQVATDPAALAAKLIGSFRVRAERQGTALSWLGQPTPGPLPTDPDKLEQILVHLLDNALKFTRVGAVTLELASADDGQTALFTVRDSGRGLTLEQRERIRLDFAQAPDSPDRAFGSVGLGLTLCRRLAEGLGGQLQVDSEPGVGSAFTLRLPVRDLGEAAP